MLTLPRQPWLRFTPNAKRCGLSNRRALANAHVLIDGDGTQTLVRFHAGDVVLGLRLPTEAPVAEPMTLTFAEWDQALQANTPTVSLKGTKSRSKMAWPAVPEVCQPVSPTLLTALHEASHCVGAEPGKYASHRIQLHGANGQVVSTDAQQALLHGGFCFPFTESLLIPAVPLFGSKDWPSLSNVQIGVLDDWLYLDAAPWCVWLALDRVGRFPDTASVIPKVARFRWQFHESDVVSLLRVLPTTSKDDDTRSVTLVLDKGLTLRWRDVGNETVHELPLPQSTANGQAVTVVLHRDQLALSLQLGFRQFHGQRPEQPVCATNGDRQHVLVTQPSSMALTGAFPVETAPVTPVRQGPLQPLGLPSASPAEVEAEPTLDLFAEVEALRVALSDALQCVGRIVHALKHSRKERRTLAGVYSRLRPLNLGGKRL